VTDAVDGVSDQLVLPGLETSPWELLPETPPRQRRQADGVVLVLREPDRRGLDPDARVHAAAILLALDAEAAASS
jgi:hypothetical protein